ncbi:hypothetical protein ABTX15_13525 [Micromonospora sp. NPDC094482]|uniref:hypothetical protein n=1 Tax=unclassified Micromonospora TaxID=2617518 RepID=UPI00332B1396
MPTKRASGLTTLEGHVWHAYLLGARSVLRRLGSRTRDKTALAATFEAVCRGVISRLGQYCCGPAEIRQFAELAARSRPRGTAGLTADEVSRVIFSELDAGGTDNDIAPAHRVLAQTAILTTTVRELGLTPNEFDELVSEAESRATQWGYKLTPYRPGLLMRWRFEIAEGRWYGWPSGRQRWSDERMGAFLSWLRETKLDP